MQAREDTWAKGPAGALAVTVEEWQGEPRPGHPVLDGYELWPLWISGIGYSQVYIPNTNITRC